MGRAVTVFLTIQGGSGGIGVGVPWWHRGHRRRRAEEAVSLTAAADRSRVRSPRRFSANQATGGAGGSGRPRRPRNRRSRWNRRQLGRRHDGGAPATVSAVPAEEEDLPAKATAAESSTISTASVTFKPQKSSKPPVATAFFSNSQRAARGALGGTGGSGHGGAGGNGGSVGAGSSGGAGRRQWRQRRVCQ